MKNIELENIELGKLYIYSDIEGRVYDVSKAVKILKKLLSLKYRHYKLKFEIVTVNPDDEKLFGKVVARRFNIGNIGNYSLLVSDIDEFSLIRFVEELFDIKSADRDKVKRIESAKDNGLRCGLDEAFYKTVTVCHSLNLNRSIEEAMPKRLLKVEDAALEIYGDAIDDEFLESERLIEKEEDEEDSVIEKTEKDKEICLNQISELILYYMAKFKEVPPLAEIEKLCEQHLSLETNDVSHVVVDENLKLLLSDYNNIEIKLTPLLKTLYILFLNHPEGIILKEISNYKNEIEMIYGVIKPNRDDEVFSYSLKNLFDATSGSLVQKISKINKCLQNIIIHSGIQEKYLIKGRRSERYKVLINRDLVQLPRALAQ